MPDDTGQIENPSAPLSEQRYVMKSIRQESGTLLPTLELPLSIKSGRYKKNGLSLCSWKDKPFFYV